MSRSTKDDPAGDFSAVTLVVDSHPNAQSHSGEVRTEYTSLSPPLQLMRNPETPWLKQQIPRLPLRQHA